MRAATRKQTNREIRRALGPQGLEYVRDQNKALFALAGILLGRNFFGRLRWLFFGK